MFKMYTRFVDGQYRLAGSFSINTDCYYLHKLSHAEKIRRVRDCIVRLNKETKYNKTNRSNEGPWRMQVRMWSSTRQRYNHLIVAYLKGEAMKYSLNNLSIKNLIEYFEEMTYANWMESNQFRTWVESHKH